MKIAFYTLGCKVNQYETQVMSQMFAGAGYEVVDAREAADVYVVNSCTVTASGDAKTRQLLRRFKTRCPQALIVLTGCFPQAFPDAAEKLPEADVISGARCRGALLEMVEESLAYGRRVVRITPHEKKEPFEQMRVTGAGGRTRAYVKVEDGCPRRCAYCIIPTARGPVRSKPPEQIAQEVAGLGEAGYAEVVLAGINLSCYGLDLGLSLADAVHTAASQPGIARVRLGSLEPELFVPDLIGRLKHEEKLCPQFHLSLQSGCADTLKRMNRQYTPREYREIVDMLRGAFDNCAITTDIMTGFPGESETDFLESVSFAREIGFAKAHVFPYSARPGTQAAEMADQIENSVKERRAHEMAQAMAESRKSFLQAQIGKKLSVLFEKRMDTGLFGHSENYMPVLAEDGGEGLKGKIREVLVLNAGETGCVGKLCD